MLTTNTSGSRIKTEKDTLSTLTSSNVGEPNDSLSNENHPLVSMPIELSMIIGYFTNQEDLASLVLVCSVWSQVFNKNEFWIEKIRNDFDLNLSTESSISLLRLSTRKTSDSLDHLDELDREEKKIDYEVECLDPNTQAKKIYLWMAKASKPENLESSRNSLIGYCSSYNHGKEQNIPIQSVILSYIKLGVFIDLDVLMQLINSLAYEDKSTTDIFMKTKPKEIDNKSCLSFMMNLASQGGEKFWDVFEKNSKNHPAKFFRDIQGLFFLLIKQYFFSKQKNNNNDFTFLKRLTYGLLPNLSAETIKQIVEGIREKQRLTKGTDEALNRIFREIRMLFNPLFCGKDCQCLELFNNIESNSKFEEVYRYFSPVLNVENAAKVIIQHIKRPDSQSSFHNLLDFIKNDKIKGPGILVFLCDNYKEDLQQIISCESSWYLKQNLENCFQLLSLDYCVHFATIMLNGNVSLYNLFREIKQIFPQDEKNASGRKEAFFEKLIKKHPDVVEMALLQSCKDDSLISSKFEELYSCFSPFLNVETAKKVLIQCVKRPQNHFKDLLALIKDDELKGSQILLSLYDSHKEDLQQVILSEPYYKVKDNIENCFQLLSVDDCLHFVGMMLNGEASLLSLFLDLKEIYSQKKENLSCSKEAFFKKLMEESPDDFERAFLKPYKEGAVVRYFQKELYQYFFNLMTMDAIALFLKKTIMKIGTEKDRSTVYEMMASIPEKLKDRVITQVQNSKNFKEELKRENFKKLLAYSKTVHRFFNALKFSNHFLEPNEIASLLHNIITADLNAFSFTSLFIYIKNEEELIKNFCVQYPETIIAGFLHQSPRENEDLIKNSYGMREGFFNLFFLHLSLNNRAHILNKLYNQKRINDKVGKRSFKKWIENPSNLPNNLKTYLANRRFLPDFYVTSERYAPLSVCRLTMKGFFNLIQRAACTSTLFELKELYDYLKNNSNWEKDAHLLSNSIRPVFYEKHETFSAFIYHIIVMNRELFSDAVHSLFTDTILKNLFNGLDRTHLSRLYNKIKEAPNDGNSEFRSLCKGKNLRGGQGYVRTLKWQSVLSIIKETLLKKVEESGFKAKETEKRIFQHQRGISSRPFKETKTYRRYKQYSRSLKPRLSQCYTGPHVKETQVRYLEAFGARFKKIKFKDKEEISDFINAEFREEFSKEKLFLFLKHPKTNSFRAIKTAFNQALVDSKDEQQPLGGRCIASLIGVKDFHAFEISSTDSISDLLYGALPRYPDKFVAALRTYSSSQLVLFFDFFTREQLVDFYGKIKKAPIDKTSPYRALCKERHAVVRGAYGRTNTWQRVLHEIKNVLLYKVTHSDTHKQANDSEIRVFKHKHGRTPNLFSKTGTYKRYEGCLSSQSENVETVVQLQGQT